MSEKQQNKNGNQNRVIWDVVATPPENALRTIQGGRLKGMTDINPQWRYEVMTEVFGPIGEGWKFEITKLWTETYGEEVLAFAQVSVYHRLTKDCDWSEAVQGIGGSRLCTKEKHGIYVSDEGYKMAVTDALSTALKLLGVGATIYRGLTDSKYTDRREDSQAPEPEQHTARAPEIDESEEFPNIIATINHISAREATSAAGKKYTKYGIKLGNTWANTINDKLANAAREMKGQEVSAVLKKTNWGYDLVSIAPPMDDGESEQYEEEDNLRF